MLVPTSTYRHLVFIHLFGTALTSDNMPENLASSVRERVEKALEMCRPYLQADGGDVELLGIGEDNVVELRYQGTCTICPMSRMTLRAGIERTIMQCAPEVKRVEAVSRN